MSNFNWESFFCVIFAYSYKHDKQLKGENDDGKRCSWVDEKSEIYKNYHDHEWGVPVYDDEKLYEMFLLETFQAGLSWITILKKREAFRVAFDNFDVIKIANYDDKKVMELLANEKIIRSKRKIGAAINNAKIFISIQTEFGSFLTIFGVLVTIKLLKIRIIILKQQRSYLMIFRWI